MADSQLAFCGDALGVLQHAVSFKARDPMLNGIMAELALQVAPMGFIVSATHAGSECNATCDALSRDHVKAHSLPMLASSKRSKDVVSEWRYLSRCT